MTAESRTRAPARVLVAIALVAVAVVALDQFTKTLAVERLSDGPVDVFWTLRFALSFNSGAAFSMGTGLTPLIIVGAVVLVSALVLFARTATSMAVGIAIGLLLGGALGNLADRLFRGHDGAVVDFIDLQWWPVFNVADIGVSAGAVLLVLATLLDERESRRDDGVERQERA